MEVPGPQLHSQLVEADQRRQPAGSGNLSILTDEVDDLHQQLIDAKVQIIVPPDDRDYGLRDFSCKDLDGNIIVFGTDIN